MRFTIFRLPAVAVIGALAIALTGCSSADTEWEPTKEVTPEIGAGPPETRTSSPNPLEYENPEFEDVPGESAVSCDSRTVSTTEGPVTLKNADIVDGEIVYYFAPAASVYNSYRFQAQFDEGAFYVEEPSSGMHQAYSVNQDGSREIHPIGLGSAKHTYKFTVPGDVATGQPEWVSASVNGESVGTCHFS